MKKLWQGFSGAAVVAWLTCILLGSTAAPAKASLAIINGGFEDPPTSSYTISGISGWVPASTDGGVWNINSSPLGFWSASAPEGNQVGWLSSAPGGGSITISQTVGDTAVAGGIYTFTGSAGHPLGYGATYGGGATIYTVSILLGGVPVASYSGTGPEGRFEGFTVSYTALAGDAGQSLGVRLSTSHAQSAFDDLNLTLAAVPEPSTYLAGALLALVFGVQGFRSLRSRKQTA